MTEGNPQTTAPPTLESDIQDFFDSHRHHGFGVSFILSHLEINWIMKAVHPGLTTYQTILKNVDDEDLSEIDREFDAGLQGVGSRWEAILRLPFRYYEK